MPTWAIDPKTGQIKGGSYVDFEGADLVNVRSILSANNAWSIDEDGVIKAKEVQAEKIKTRELITEEAEVGSSEKPTGITIYDVYTKEPHCITVVAGVLNAAAGKCPKDTSGISPSVGAATPDAATVDSASSPQAVESSGVDGGIEPTPSAASAEESLGVGEIAPATTTQDDQTVTTTPTSPEPTPPPTEPTAPAPSIEVPPEIVPEPAAIESAPATTTNQ